MAVTNWSGATNSCPKRLAHLWHLRVIGVSQLAIFVFLFFFLCFFDGALLDFHCRATEFCMSLLLFLPARCIFNSCHFLYRGSYFCHMVRWIQAMPCSGMHGVGWLNACMHHQLQNVRKKQKQLKQQTANNNTTKTNNNNCKIIRDYFEKQQQ